MWGNVSVLLVGLILLVGGASVMIRGATALARALGVPPVVIGLTIVAFGTSAPELVVNTTAALSGQTELAFGSIIGSCTINLGWVLAITALVRPINVEPSIISRELPMMLLATLAFSILSLDRLTDNAPENLLTRGNGLILILLFGVFLYYTISNIVNKSKKAQQIDPFIAEVTVDVKRKPSISRGLSLMMTLAGLLGVVMGGQVTVRGAVDIAVAMGISPFIIGLTIISFGTTLPELVTGILAARRGEGDIAIGNVVGSNIFNLLFVGGVVSILSPIRVPENGGADLLALTMLTLVTLPIAIRGQRMVTRAEGGILLCLYFGYLAWRLANRL